MRVTSSSQGEKERKEVEAYSPSSNYRIPPKASASFKKYKPVSTHPQVNRTPRIMGNISWLSKDQQDPTTQVLHPPEELSQDLRVRLTPQGPWGTLLKGNST